MGKSIVYATLIVWVVELAWYSKSGLEGRMFAPLGLAYMVSLVTDPARPHHIIVPAG